MGKHGRGSEPAAWKASGGTQSLGLSSGFGMRRKRGRPREREEREGEGIKIEGVCGERGGQKRERGGEGKETEWGTKSTKRERGEWASGQEEGARGSEPSADEGKRNGAPSGGEQGGEWKAKSDNERSIRENKAGRRSEDKKSKGTVKKPRRGSADKQGGEVEGVGGMAIDANGIKLQQKNVGGRGRPLHSGRNIPDRRRKNEEWANKTQVRIRKAKEGREKPEKGKAGRGKKSSKTRVDNAARDSSEATGKRSRPKSAAGGATPSAQQGSCKSRGRRNTRPAPEPHRLASANPTCATQPRPEPVPKHCMHARPELLGKHRTQARIEPGLSSKQAFPVQRRMPPFPKCLGQAVPEIPSPGAVPYVVRRKRTPKGKEARQPNRARGVIRSKQGQMNKQHKFRNKKRTHGEQPQGAEPRRAAKRSRTRGEEVDGEEKKGEEQGEDEAPPQSARVGDKGQCLVKIKASPDEHKRTSVAGWEPTQGQRREGVVAPDSVGRPTGAECGTGARAVRGICKSAAAVSSGRPKIIKRVHL